MFEKIILKIPLFGKKIYAKIYKNKLLLQSKIELEDSIKGKKYNSFQDFLLECPSYCVDKSNIGSIIRSILESFGVIYQQYVFIDKSSSKDKTAYLRKVGNILLNGKGTYLTPWDSEKEIIYFDINDMRPLIDKTKDIDWYNPDTCADVVTSITNSKTLENMNGEDTLDKYTLILMVLVALSIIISIVSIYQGIETQKTVVHTFEALNNTLSGFK